MEEQRIQDFLTPSVQSQEAEFQRAGFWKKAGMVVKKAFLPNILQPTITAEDRLDTAHLKTASQFGSTLEGAGIVGTVAGAFITGPLTYLGGRAFTLMSEVMQKRDMAMKVNAPIVSK